MKPNFYTLMLMMTGVILLVFVILLISLTFINYMVLKYQIRQQEIEDKKREKMGIDYFFQDEEDEHKLPPPKDEEFKEVPDDLFDKVIADKNKKNK